MLEIHAHFDHQLRIILFMDHLLRREETVQLPDGRFALVQLVYTTHVKSRLGEPIDQMVRLYG